MCLQLFQLTCKCGHLHLRRKRKGEIEGGRKRREERSSHQRQHKAQALSSRNDLAPHDQTSAYLKSEKLLKNKGLFSPRPTEKKNKKEKKSPFHCLFSRTGCLSHLRLLFTALQVCPMSRFFLTTSAFHFYFLTALHRPILYYYFFLNGGHCNRFIPASDNLKWICRAQRLNYQTRPKFSERKSQISQCTAASLLPLGSRG